MIIGAARDIFERIARFADRHSPQTLFARALIIIVVPMLLLQALSAWWFYSQRGDNVTNRLAILLVRDLRMLIALRTEFPDDAHRAWIISRSAQDLLLFVSFRKGIVRPFREPEYFDIAAREVQGALEADLKRNYYIDNNIGGGQMLIEIQLNDDDVMDVLVPHVRLTFGSSFAYVVAQVGLGLVLFGLAIWFMHRELVPIAHLGVAADALGKGRDVPDFAFSGGTREVRNAATAFHTMRIRLRRSIQQRTEMLAGVSHDLRTPLTRMKLSLALLPESPETKELSDDVSDMERMIEGYLAFARGEGDEDPIPTDLSEILEDVAAGARRDNANVEVTWRCLTNLVSNALRYGTMVQLQAVRGRTSVEITIEDNGPGIPPDKYEDVFRPFFRLDESRNVDTGGVGLGLTIARDVARSHGGDVALAPSALGGLRVIVRIPI
jgi:two-component system osmolarity sensor histidine kinase EnvZ